jgi:hypothetical protein
VKAEIPEQIERFTTAASSQQHAALRSDSGEYVLYTDHLAKVEELEQQLGEARRDTQLEREMKVSECESANEWASRVDLYRRVTARITETFKSRGAWKQGNVASINALADRAEKAEQLLAEARASVVKSIETMAGPLGRARSRALDGVSDTDQMRDLDLVVDGVKELRASLASQEEQK